MEFDTKWKTQNHGGNILFLVKIEENGTLTSLIPHSIWKGVLSK